MGICFVVLGVCYSRVSAIFFWCFFFVFGGVFALLGGDFAFFLVISRIGGCFRATRPLFRAQREFFWLFFFFRGAVVSET